MVLTSETSLTPDFSLGAHGPGLTPPAHGPGLSPRAGDQGPIFRILGSPDLDALHEYLTGLSEETRHRFGPHPFDRATLEGLYREQGSHTGYIAVEEESGRIIAYSVIKAGFLEHDRPRLNGYGLNPDAITDATFAPSVADDWQGRGLGPRLYEFMVADLKARGIGRLILWGGVQCSNLRAVNYYRKLGFTILGEFEYYGMNFDMIKEIKPMIC
jgi:ribosomal protein S18 acetylase RimI-like enzyme